MSRLCGLWCAGALTLALGCRAPAVSDSGGEQPEPEPEPALTVEQPPTCEGQPCEAPRQCISYYGIAGPSGPMFHACEIRCEREVDDGGCPDGMRCVTIADGPGDVCQPAQ